MTWALDTPIGVGGAAANATSVALTTTNAVAPGSWIFLVTGSFSNVAISSITGTGLTWTTQNFFSTFNVHLSRAYAPAGLAISTVVTVNFASSTGVPVTAGIAFSGGDANTFSDGTANNANASGTPWVGGSVITPGASDLIIGCAYTDTRDTTETANGGYTEGIDAINPTAGGNGTLALVYQLNAPPGTYQPGGTWAGAAITPAITATFSNVPSLVMAPTFNAIPFMR